MCLFPIANYEVLSWVQMSCKSELYHTVLFHIVLSARVTKWQL